MRRKILLYVTAVPLLVLFLPLAFILWPLCALYFQVVMSLGALGGLRDRRGFTWECFGVRMHMSTWATVPERKRRRRVAERQ